MGLRAFRGVARVSSQGFFDCEVPGSAASYWAYLRHGKPTVVAVLVSGLIYGVISWATGVISWVAEVITH